MKYLILLLILLSGCRITINSTNDGYKDFRTNQPVEQFINVEDSANPYQYVEVSSSDVKAYSSKRTTTLIYQLAPWCSPCIREFREDYGKIDSISKAMKGVKILVVNNSYGFVSQIERLYRKLGYESPIYVISGAVHGNKIEDKVRSFVKDLCDTCQPSLNGGIFVYRDGKMQGYFRRHSSDWKEVFQVLGN